MYGSAAWTLNKNMETTLQRAQRRMLRLILGTPRRKTKQAATDDNHSSHSTDDVASNTSSTNLEHLIELTDQELLEPWPDFIKRATRTAEAHLERLNIEDWTTVYLRKKWRWAARVAQQPDDRWSRLVVQWDPEVTHPRRAKRPQARPRTRWDDDINVYLCHCYNYDNNKSCDDNNDYGTNNTTTPHWLQLGVNPVTWKSHEQSFIEYVRKVTKNTTTRQQQQQQERQGQGQQQQ